MREWEISQYRSYIQNAIPSIIMFVDKSAQLCDRKLLALISLEVVQLVE